ncbi:MAG: hypothetical protein VW230_06430 [Candidatus Poseidoniales archaeon]
MIDGDIEKKGSVSISGGGHALLMCLVHDSEKPFEDCPFNSIVEAFRFAFALGYSSGNRVQKEGKKHGISPREFVVTEYTEILRNEIEEHGGSLGSVISEYAEAGCEIITAHLEENNQILSLI